MFCVLGGGERSMENLNMNKFKAEHEQKFSSGSVSVKGIQSRGLVAGEFPRFYGGMSLQV
jgi:hypothetical protein